MMEDLWKEKKRSSDNVPAALVVKPKGITSFHIPCNGKKPLSPFAIVAKNRFSRKCIHAAIKRGHTHHCTRRFIWLRHADISDPRGASCSTLDHFCTKQNSSAQSFKPLRRFRNELKLCQFYNVALVSNPEMQLLDNLEHHTHRSR